MQTFLLILIRALNDSFDDSLTKMSKAASHHTVLACIAHSLASQRLTLGGPADAQDMTSRSLSPKQAMLGYQLLLLKSTNVPCVATPSGSIAKTLLNQGAGKEAFAPAKRVVLSDVYSKLVK